jgi:hypothetical protein
MKFLNKKEDVINFKLTSYGKYLLSIGEFEPEFYAFFDDNVLYDSRYGGFYEGPNNAYKRIKNDTQYLATQTVFEELETPGEMIAEGSMAYFDVDVNPTLRRPTNSSINAASAIGDAFLEGDVQTAPAWKMVLLNGAILSSSTKDARNNIQIPQIDIRLDYRLKAINPDYINSRPAKDIRRSVSLTDRFADGKVIELISDGLMIYLEEQNTILLNDNFDIEVFEVVSGALNPLCESCTSGPESQKRDKYERLFFENEHDRLGGAPITDEYINYMNTKIQRSYDKTSTQASSSVSYYFDIVKDELVNRQTACAGVEVFNKQSLYVNLDFDCDDITDNVPNAGFVDIYGKVTEPEPCQ